MTRAATRPLVRPAAPARTPANIVEAWARALKTVLSDPTIQSGLESRGVKAADGSTRQLQDALLRDGPYWADVVRRAGITLD